VIHDIHVILHLASREEYPEDYTWQYKAWASRATKRIVKSADRIITVSHSVAMELQSFLGVARTEFFQFIMGLITTAFVLSMTRRRLSPCESAMLFLSPFTCLSARTARRKICD